MRIKTTAENLKGQLLFSSLFAESAESQAVKTFEKDGKTEVKTLDGKPVHRTSLKALRLDGAGKAIGEDRNISLGLLNQHEISGGKLYEADGEVWITPYEKNGRVALSIVVEKVKETSSNAPKFSVGGNHNG